MENESTTRPPLVLFQYINGSHGTHSYQIVDQRRYLKTIPVETRRAVSRIKQPIIDTTGMKNGNLSREQQLRWLELSKDG